MQCVLTCKERPVFVLSFSRYIGIKHYTLGGEKVPDAIQYTE